MSIKFQAKHPSGFTVDSPLQPLVFPDGAVHITGADTETEYQYQIADVRGMDHTDLFTLAMWAMACDERSEKKVIILPYIPGARMDRGIVEGSAVYAWFILNDIAPHQIITIDTHSPRSVLFYENYARDKKLLNFTVFPVERIIRKEVQDPTQDMKANNIYSGVIAPDKGAVDRATRAARAMGIPVYRAEKTRDFATGKLSGFHMVDDLPEEGRLLIVDDICDGGGTFVGLAEATGLPRERLDLWVTHGIFSKGIHVLSDHFGVVHTTDSYYRGDSWKLKDDANGDKAAIDFEVKVHKLIPYLYPEIKLETS